MRACPPNGPPETQVACPHCGFEAHGFPEEIAHMTTWHPEVVAERLRAVGEDVTAEAIRASAGPDFPPRP
jgi:hypothetical protein